MAFNNINNNNCANDAPASSGAYIPHQRMYQRQNGFVENGAGSNPETRPLRYHQALQDPRGPASQKHYQLPVLEGDLFTEFEESHKTPTGSVKRPADSSMAPPLPPKRGSRHLSNVPTPDDVVSVTRQCKLLDRNVNVEVSHLQANRQISLQQELGIERKRDGQTVSMQNDVSSNILS